MIELMKFAHDMKSIFYDEEKKVFESSQIGEAWQICSHAARYVFELQKQIPD
jgi:hypothetical protein